MSPRSGLSLADYLHDRLGRAVDDMHAVDADIFLQENRDVFVEHLIGTHLPTEISIDWESPTRTDVRETTTEVADPFTRDVRSLRASTVTITVPVRGDTALFCHQASRFSMSEDPAGVSITSGAIEIQVVQRTLTTEAVDAGIAAARTTLQSRAEWANADVTAFRDAARRHLHNQYTARRERILNDRGVADSLGIPVRSTAQPRPPVPARRKHVPLAIRRTQKKFAPEPVLDEAIYRDVLDVVQGWTDTLERVPRTAHKLDEEERRDLLLGTLNGYWLGGAGGELFNGQGKTDILIREDNRNVFIAECKIWRGPRSITAALDQLLSYLVWRDSKAALIVFIETVAAATTIADLHSVVEEHPRHILTTPGGVPARQVDYVMAGEDDGRRVALAVLPVVTGKT